MSEQDGTKASSLEYPDNLDSLAWRVYWEKQGQPWRTEPEINRKRQIYLTQRRNIKAIVEQGIYPFKGIKLNRADVEWLLATHENGRGPIDWNDESQYGRKGLDLRGADLCEVDLSRLPLSGMNGGFDYRDRDDEERPEAAAIHLERANLVYTHLEGANFNSAHLEGAIIGFAHLEKSDFHHVHLEEAKLSSASLVGAYLDSAHLEKADFRFAHLENTNLNNAHLEGANLLDAHLEGAGLNGAFLAHATELFGIYLSNRQFGGAYLADIHWGDANVVVVDWSIVPMLGNELEARKPKLLSYDVRKSKGVRIREYRDAVRAYRQLSVVLRNQGLNEDAARFAYRAQLMQRVVFRLQRKIGQYLFSGFLDLLAGYGYKPWRSFLAYLLVIVAFATAYFVIGHIVGPVLSPLGSVVFSMTSFHGRGFFPGGIGLDDPLTVLAALEAFVGLLIEVTFIATLTQRLFGK